MEENKNEKQEEAGEQPTEDIGTGDKPQKHDKIDDANLAAKRMEDAEKALKIQADRIERLAIDNKLSGKSEAGLDPGKPTLTEAEKASRDRIKAVGLSGGAQWAKNMDKEDAN